MEFFQKNLNRISIQTIDKNKIKMSFYNLYNLYDLEQFDVHGLKEYEHELPFKLTDNMLQFVFYLQLN